MSFGWSSILTSNAENITRPESEWSTKLFHSNSIEKTGYSNEYTKTSSEVHNNSSPWRDNVIQYRWLIFIVIIALIFLLFIFIPIMSNGETVHQRTNSALYGELLDESHFPCKKNRSEYIDKVNRGYKLLKNKSLVVCGLVYNLGKNKTKMMVKRLKSLALMSPKNGCPDVLSNSWKDCRFVIYSADSTDGTFELLKELTSDDHRFMIIDKKVDKVGLSRFAKMSKLRNHVIESVGEMVNQDEGFHPDYLIMMDLDLNGPVSFEGVAHSVSLIEDDYYRAIFANGLISGVLSYHLPPVGYTYFDPLATMLPRQKKYSRNDPHINSIIQNKSVLGKIKEKNLFKRNMFDSNYKIIRVRGDPVIECISGFGGLAIYDYELFFPNSVEETNEKEYRYVMNDYLCEHLTLHIQMYYDYVRMAINPSLILLTGITH